MTTSRIVHPRMQQEISRYHYHTSVRLCTRQETLNTLKEAIITSVPTDRVYKAYCEPANKDQEIRRADQSLVLEAFTFYLDGFYPHINTEFDILVDNVILHDIISVTQDDTNSFTVLTTEVAKPGRYG